MPPTTPSARSRPSTWSGSGRRRRSAGGPPPRAACVNWILFVQQLINGLSLGAIYAVIALGYTMVYGIIELINFAHGDVYSAGSFVALAALTLLGATRHTAAAGLVFALVVAFLAAMLV